MEWFKSIDNCKENDNHWNEDGSCLISLNVWKDSKKTGEHLRSSHPNMSAGERKGLKKHSTRFVTEADEFDLSVGNEVFHNSSDDFRNLTIKTLAELWIKACTVFFANKEGKAVHTRKERNENTTPTNAVIPFGPWIFWTKSDWCDIKYNFSRWQRKQSRNNISDKSPTMDNPILLS